MRWITVEWCLQREEEDAMLAEWKKEGEGVRERVKESRRKKMEEIQKRRKKVRPVLVGRQE